MHTTKQVALPPYFPVVPKGCEAKADPLFKCISGKATEKLRAMEQQQQQQEQLEDPLNLCRELIVKYKSCCDKQLKNRKNWILTETYRVQDEYRYNKAGPRGNNEDSK